jgi:predicted HicB family RNase H-like nuclease
MMQYKGYLGAVEYDDEARVFHGEVLNMRDVITFQGTSVEQLEQAFRESVDDYLEWCAQDGVAPERPYSGRFNLRISPELHQKLAAAAKKKRVSINNFVEQAVADKVVSVL